MKLVINDVKTGKSYNKELKEDQVNIFENKKMREKISGGSIGFSGYELEITGGTDAAGFPMRFDVEGTSRKKIVLTSGPCVKIKRKGMKKRKTVAGNTIKRSNSQVNLKIIEYGKKEISSYFESKETKEEKKPEEQPEKKEAKKESKGQEVKK